MNIERLLQFVILFIAKKVSTPSTTRDSFRIFLALECGANLRYTANLPFGCKRMRAGALTNCRAASDREQTLHSALINFQLPSKLFTKQHLTHKFQSLASLCMYIYTVCRRVHLHTSGISANNEMHIALAFRLQRLLSAASDARRGSIRQASHLRSRSWLQLHV